MLRVENAQVLAFLKATHPRATNKDVLLQLYPLKQKKVTAF